MMWFNYLWRTVLQLLFTLLAYVLAPVLPLFCNADGWLPNWLKWFQTQDASLDAGWKHGYFQPYKFALPERVWLWIMRTRWLLRNPAYGFCYYALGIPYDPAQWRIITHTTQNGALMYFYAETLDGKYFCYTDYHGLKLGYKLWWGFDPTNANLLPTLPAYMGPDNRIPICFTPF